MAKILKCDDCGSIIQVLVEDDGDTCDTHMLNIPVQTEGDKSPKHKPVVEIDGDKVTVKVGEAAHPMDDDHYIQFLVVEAGNEQYFFKLPFYFLRIRREVSVFFIISNQLQQQNNEILQLIFNKMRQVPIFFL